MDAFKSQILSDGYVATILFEESHKNGDGTVGVTKERVLYETHTNDFMLARERAWDEVFRAFRGRLNKPEHRSVSVYV